LGPAHRRRIAGQTAGETGGTAPAGPARGPFPRLAER